MAVLGGGGLFHIREVPLYTQRQTVRSEDSAHVGAIGLALEPLAGRLVNRVRGRAVVKELPLPPGGPLFLRGYRGTSLIRNRLSPGPYDRTPRVISWS